MWRRSLAWSPTIALTWLWGLGFFYSMHVTFTYGWPGFLAFAVPNAAGLALFGCGIDRFGPPDLQARFDAVAGRCSGVLLAYQVAAVGITLFAIAADYLHPLLGNLALPTVLLLAVTASAVGHIARVQDFRALHAAMLAAGLALAATALATMPATPTTHRAAAFDSRTYGLLLPGLVGFLLGPWLDLQQWHRALRMRHDGVSVARAYAAGGLLFFALISVNAGFATTLPDVATLQRGFDGVAEASSALARTLAAAGPAGALPAWLFGLWTAIAVASTIDSAYAATAWFLAARVRRSNSPILALVPAGLVQSPLWMLAASLAFAGAAYGMGAPLLAMMAPFATFFIGYAACLLLQMTLNTGPHDPMLCFLLGIAAAASFAIADYAAIAPLMAVSPLLPLLAAAPLLARRSAAAPAEAGPPVHARAMPPTPLASPTAAVAHPADAIGRALATADPQREPARTPESARGPSMGWFDGNWFQYDVIPTYDDTNSVGNIYFANYVRWVGKTRELFFARCVPNFDLKTTSFFILTAEFAHKFLRETREFEAILVRIRVGKNNRKFVTLEHEIRAADGLLLGRGSQQLMFIDSVSHQLIDVPADMLRGFLPYLAQVPAAR